jgi:hypothetical protein
MYLKNIQANREDVSDDLNIAILASTGGDLCAI